MRSVTTYSKPLEYWKHTLVRLLLLEKKEEGEKGREGEREGEGERG